jgi:hypothetical protein
MPVGGPWRPEAVTLADFDPLRHGWSDPGGLGGPWAVYRFMQRLAADGSAMGLTAWVYSRPNGPLYHRVIVPSCDDNTTVELASAAGNVGFRPGQYVSIGQTRQGAVILGSPPTGLIGASGFGLQTLDAGAFDDLRLVSCEPTEVPAGSVDFELALHGAGFRESPIDEFVAAVYVGDEASPDFGDYEADPYVTLHSPVWEDAETVTILADVLETAPAGYAVTVAYRRGA